MRVVTVFVDFSVFELFGKRLSGSSRILHMGLVWRLDPECCLVLWRRLCIVNNDYVETIVPFTMYSYV